MKLRLHYQDKESYQLLRSGLVTKDLKYFYWTIYFLKGFVSPNHQEFLPNK